ncbi:MAG: tetratricopeptide repeat protein [Verrucomicrobia bacterium]|nr:tetratricopeptide repeat protein [Verrucomicrobiota bacterium]
MRYIRLIGIGFVALSVSAASLHAQGTKEAANLTKEGIEASKAQDWNKAVDAFRKAAHLESRYVPNLVAALRHRAIAYRDQQKFPEAAADLDEAIKLKSDDPDIFEQRGYVAMMMKDFDKALADYSDAIKLNPNEAKYYQVRAYILQTKNDFNGALNDTNKVLQLDPQNADAQERKRFLEAKLHGPATPPPLPSGPIANPNAPRPASSETPSNEVQPVSPPPKP